MVLLNSSLPAWWGGWHFQ